MAATTIDPYKAYSEMYQKRTDAINAQTKQAESERLQREQAAQKTLESSNRGVYTTYKNAINPYGRMASQNNFSQGVSDYYNNASYGTMLQGLGANQYNYNDAMNNSNSLWQNYLAQKAGQEADALNDYNAGVLAQQKYDKEQEDAEKERQRAIEEFNLQLKLQQEQLARQKAQDEEDKRRWELEWARQQELDKQSSSGSSTRSSSTTKSDDFTETPTPASATKSSSGTGSQQYKDTGTVARTGYEPSTVPGMRYSVQYDSKGKVIKRTLVRDPNSKVQGRVYLKKY